MEVDLKTCSKEVISHGRVKVLLGRVLKLPTQISLLVGYLQISVMVELDADSGDNFQARTKSHSSGVEKPRIPNSRRVVEEDDDGSPCHDDISPPLLNFEKSSSKSLAGNRLAGHKGSERDLGLDSTSDFGSPDTIFGSMGRGLLGLGWLDHGLGPVNSELPFAFGSNDRRPSLLSGLSSKCGMRIRPLIALVPLLHQRRRKGSLGLRCLKGRERSDDRLLSRRLP